MGEVNFEQMRRHMVQEICAHVAMVKAHIGKTALSDRVMEAMVSVPRHKFVPVELRAFAYANTPLPIGHGKTISQPFIVALMTDLLAVNAGERVLEIGTGLGYQSAILAELAERVYSVEIIDELTEEANKRLAGQGYTNVETKRSDGYHGWPAHAPFDKIMVTAAPDLIPPGAADAAEAWRQDGDPGRHAGRPAAVAGPEGCGRPHQHARDPAGAVLGARVRRAAAFGQLGRRRGLSPGSSNIAGAGRS